MEEKTKLLIAVGAALAANCQPCLKITIKKARDNGVEDKEILEAIGVARFIRRNSMAQIDRLASALGENADTDEAKGGCGCT